MLSKRETEEIALKSSLYEAVAKKKFTLQKHCKIRVDKYDIHISNSWSKTVYICRVCGEIIDSVNGDYYGL